MTQPTGVFVRLPMSKDDKRKVYEGSPYKGGLERALLTIGTPVTGGELEVVSGGYGAEYQVLHGGEWQTVPYRVWLDEVDADKCRSEQKHFPKLVRQSDALAKLAEKDAEIVRLRKHLERIDRLIMGNDDPVKIFCGIHGSCEEALKGPEA